MSTAPPLFALCDVNSMYCSCERAFDPKLIGKPVIVLSNNDGNAVARTEEAKALGIKMGEPFFKIRHLVKEQGLVALSSNYVLYGDMSARFSAILSEYSPSVEIYSIDENFLRVDGMEALWPSFTAMGQTIRQRIRQDIALPVCVGYGPSKTLAKFANFLAKKNKQFDGVCNLMDMTRDERVAWFERTDVSEVWGCGHRIAARLRDMGIHTVQDLRRTAPKYIRTHFGVVMERTVQELRGVSCLVMEEVAPAKKEICCSRSFGQMVTTIDDLAGAITTHVTRAAEKLRGQGSTASVVQAFVQTNRFRTDDPQYAAAVGVPLIEPSSDTRILTAAALLALRHIYRPGFQYKKAGIMLMGLQDASIRQLTLFDIADLDNTLQVMSALDAVNLRFGRGTLRLASEGMRDRGWVTKAGNCTPAYTTRWSDVPVVLA